MKTMTEIQALIVARLQAKGWLEPWHYRRSVYLYLPLPAHVRRTKGLATFRVHNRPPVRVTPSGRIVAGWR